jgi:hypothetical protein
MNMKVYIQSYLIVTMAYMGRKQSRNITKPAQVILTAMIQDNLKSLLTILQRVKNLTSDMIRLACPMHIVLSLIMFDRFSRRH